MRILGLDITRAPRRGTLTPASGSGAWFPIVREPYTGAWQKNEEVTAQTALAYFAVYGCHTLITTDIGKLRLRLMEQDADGIWNETSNPAYSPVLRKPNRYQTIQKFIEQWIGSKLTAGNAYVLKHRDDRNVVTALYVLDPSRVTPLIAEDGAVYYALGRNDLAGVVSDAELEGTVVVPAREIIHDPMVTLFHPLVGVSPLFAAGFAALQGLTIQTISEKIFRKGVRPGGILTTPAGITDAQAERLKEKFIANFSGDNIGQLAVIGGDLKYITPSMSAVDAQLIDQLRWTAATICACYHVPPALLDLGDGVTVPDLEALLQKYHAQCLQSLLHALETALDDGLGIADKVNGTQYGTEFDIDDLIWMVTATKTKAAAEAIGAGALSPNEARAKWFGLGKVAGGDTPYLQMQNYSLRALAERDSDQPFAKPTPAAPGAQALSPTDDDDEAEDDELDAAAFTALVRKHVDEAAP